LNGDWPMIKKTKKNFGPFYVNGLFMFLVTAKHVP